MKHEIDITDEIVERLRQNLPRRWLVLDGGAGEDLFPMSVVRQALEAALTPKRRWSDSQREERRAGVEAPHGAEESKGWQSEWKPGVWPYDDDCPKPTDATRRPPNPTPETIREGAHAPEVRSVCPGCGTLYLPTLGHGCGGTWRADTPPKSSDIHVSEAMKRACWDEIAAGAEITSSAGPARIYRTMELKRREEDQFHATHFERHTRKGESPRYWSHNRKDGAPDPFAKARAEGWQRTAVPHTRKDDHLARPHRRKDDPK